MTNTAEDATLLLLGQPHNRPLSCGTSVVSVSDLAYSSDLVIFLWCFSKFRRQLMGQFQSYKIAKEMWERLKVTFGQKSVIKLYALQLKFQQYVKDPKHSMAEHLREMGSLIRDLQTAGIILTDEECWG